MGGVINGGIGGGTNRGMGGRLNRGMGLDKGQMEG